MFCVPQNMEVEHGNKYIHNFQFINVLNTKIFCVSQNMEVEHGNKYIHNFQFINVLNTKMFCVSENMEVGLIFCKNRPLISLK